MNASSFVTALAQISSPNVFNPYADTCELHDRSDGPATRRRNLRSYLEAVRQLDVDTVWMGRDLGYRGGRRTGIALTDEVHFLVARNVLPGCNLQKATSGAAVAERTAAEVWNLIKLLPKAPLLWNVFPFHPYENGIPLSNRKFSRKELSTVTELNDALLSWLQIKKVVAIGQDAQTYASQFGLPVAGVRHPSYGGTTEFRASIRSLYGLAVSDEQKALF